MNPAFSLSARDLEPLLSAVLALPAFAAQVPTVVNVDDKERKPCVDWRERWIPQCKRDVQVIWGPRPQFSLFDAEHWLWFEPNQAVNLRLPSLPDDEQEILRLLVSLPFELASFGDLYKQWTPERYYGPHLPGRHYAPGWACAFHGAGHEALVSRRWLDFGPWRVLRGPGDTTLVQFHELGVDAATALEQAAPGHALLVWSRDGGGMAQRQDLVTITGEYWPAERLFEIHVREPRDITSREINDALCIRTDRHHEHKDSPVERVAYVFASPALAEFHLHALWLRELEVWTFRDGQKVRLDLDYVPTLPSRPAWVQRLEDMDAGRGFPPPAPFWPEVTTRLAAEAAAPTIALPDPGPWTLRFRSSDDEFSVVENRLELARKLGVSIELDESLEWRQVSIVLDADRVSGRLYIRHVAVSPVTATYEVEDSAAKIIRQLRRYGNLMLKVRKVWNDFVAWMGGEEHVNLFPPDTRAYVACLTFQHCLYGEGGTDALYDRMATAPLTEEDARDLAGYIEQAEGLWHEHAPVLVHAMQSGEYVPVTRDIELN
jgi:hypothetical protein